MLLIRCLLLCPAEGGPKGVDSTVGSESALAAAVGLAKQYNCTMAVSGAVDLVSG
jgi:hydroxyethylthiazole kinase-like sugar kinase family protein